MEEFDLLTHTLEPAVTLIEASAGTGKTYNIQHLYLRFVVEKNFVPNEILVVTFSEAATNELKERISDNLRSASLLLKELTPDVAESDLDNLVGYDDAIVSIIKKGIAETGYEETLRRVSFSLHGFDEAAISTIHSFCLKVLQDHAFESGIHYEIEVVEDKQEYFSQLFYDFIRSEVMHKDDFDAYLFRKRIEPQWFLAIADNVYGKDDIVCATVELPDFVDIYKKLQQEYSPESKENTYIKRNKKLLELFSIFEDNPELTLEVQLRVIELLEKLSIEKSKYFAIEFTEVFQRNFLLAKKYSGIVKEKYSLKFFEYVKELYTKQEDSPDKRQLTFDDFLYLTRRAIHRENSRLISVVRMQYSAVLVDEFQDTSGVQFDIFYSFFGGGALPFFMIGDPKQSIYAFRDADIFSYLKAVNAPDVLQRTLKKNFRSTPELLAGFNLIFANSKNHASGWSIPFVYDEIEYIDITAGLDDYKMAVFPDKRKGFEIRWNDFDGNISTKSDAVKSAMDCVVSDIINKLNLSQQGKAYFEKESLKEEFMPSDFAVLVNNNFEAVMVRDELTRRGVPAVVLKSGNIFTSHEAAQLFEILTGAANPHSEKAIMAALSSDLFGYTLSELRNICSFDEKVKGYWVEFFHRLNKLWKNYGLLVMLEHLFYTEHTLIGRSCCSLNIVVLENTQRAFTNYFQLFEIFAQKENDDSLSVAQLLSIYESYLLESANEREYEMRLESDSKAVKVITIHKSKGLQFPVVYLPFFFMQDWHKSIRISGRGTLRPYVGTFRDIDDRVMIFSEYEVAMYHDEIYMQNIAEIIRLFYVAVTRAQNKCIVLGGNIRQIEDSGLEHIFGENYSNIKLWGESEVISVVEDWKVGEDTFNWQEEDIAAHFERFTGRVPREWGIMSYSSLVSHGFERDDVRKDSVASGMLELFGAEQVFANDTSLNRKNIIPDNLAALPSSNKVGSAVHEILEEVDFTAVGECVEDEVILGKLQKFGVVDNSSSLFAAAKEVAAVKSILAILSQLKLENNAGESFTLGCVEPEKMVSEMSFYFPVRKEIILQKFSEFLSKRGLDSYRKDNNLEQVVAGLGISFQKNGFREGFMYGLIDLVFEHQGSFYFADWKTNNLQNYGGYSKGAVLASMNDSGYLLQFYIYTVVLVLYLKDRIVDFSYKEHFGGGYYLYLRGLNLEYQSEGVFFEYPTEDEVAELIEIFTGASYDN